MRHMADKPITTLEKHLERLVEGVFTRLFQRGLTARDVAINLARSMQANLLMLNDEDSRPVAPDLYHIQLHPQVQKAILTHQPDFARLLSQQLIELAGASGYRLLNTPTVHLDIDHSLPVSTINISAAHRPQTLKSTMAMKPVSVPSPSRPVSNPQLIINGTHYVPLEEGVTNIGRGSDNQITLDDPYVSRHHLQIRLRFAVYTLFDVQSRGGTRVNNVRVNEHRLRSGDVIHIGETVLVFIADEPTNHTATTTTDQLDPVEG